MPTRAMPVRRLGASTMAAAMSSSAMRGPTIPIQRALSATSSVVVAHWRLRKSISLALRSLGIFFASCGAMAFAALMATWPASARSSATERSSRVNAALCRLSAA